MAYYTQIELVNLGFKSLGTNVKISTKASLYDISNISIEDNSRIDDFCVMSGKIQIGKNVHITPQCLIAGGSEGIILENYTTIAYGVKLFTQSDDYSGATMTNSTIPKKYKKESKKKILIKEHSIIGAASIVMPGVTLNTGTAIGANSLVTKDTQAWSIYIGSPAIWMRNRSRKMLDIFKQYKKNN